MVTDIFCDRIPGDEDYLKLELFQHLRELNIIPEDLFLGEEEDPINDIYHNLVEYLITPREKSLTHILEGLSMNDRIKLQTFFCTAKAELVDKLLFSSKAVTAQNIIDNLKFSQTIGDDYLNYLTPVQKVFQMETLPEFLRAKEKENPDFLKYFLKLVTGLPFINYGNPKIGVCFTNLNNDNKMSLPVSHTCEQEIAFPKEAYDANIDTLREKLTLAVECGHSLITIK